MKQNCPVSCQLCTPVDANPPPDPTEDVCQDWDSDCDGLAESGFCSEEEDGWCAE